jgi:hypothetical protein
MHLVAVGLVAMILIGAFLAARQLGARQLELPDLLLALALLAGLFHLFAAMGLVLVLAVARYDLWRLREQPARRLVVLAAIPVVVLGWLAVAAMAPERLVTDTVVARWDIPDPTTPGAILRALWSTFFGWPDFYRSTLRPFATELPEIGLAMVAALAWFVIAHRHASWPSLLRHPGALVLYWAIVMAQFPVSDSTTRYWFPILPVVYTLLAVSLAEAFVRWRPQAELAARSWASLIFVLLFALGPDFQPRHLLNVGDDDVRYRTGAFARFAETWYARTDIRTAAETTARWHAETPDARIVVDTLPALSYYLDGEHALYLDRRRTLRFGQVSRDRGRLDLWSGQRLLGTPEDLFAYAQSAEELWLLRSTDPDRRGSDLSELAVHWPTELRRDVLGQDGRIELIRLGPSR